MNPADFTELAPGTLVTSPKGFLCFVPSPLPPKLTLAMPTIQMLARAERALGKLAGSGEMAPKPEMTQALEAFERFLQAPSERPFLVDLALLHYQFEAIHPFRDGNGRVGRLLIPLLLCERNILTKPLLYLSAYFEQHRTEYADLLLRVSQKAAWEAWIEFFLKGIAEQAMDGVERATKLMALWQHYPKRLQTARASILGQDLVDHLVMQPSIM